MKSKKFSLKHVDNVTANKISENYPSDWDMDKVFETSYKKFLESEKSTEENIHISNSETDDTLEFCHTEPVSEKHKAIFIFNKLAAAACFVMIILIFKSLCILPDNIDVNSDDIDKSPVSTYKNDNYSTQNVNTFTTADVTRKTTLSSVTVTESITTAIVTADSVVDTENDISYLTDEPKQTEILTEPEPIYDTEEPVQTTNPPETTSLTETVVSSSVNESEVTTEVNTPNYGHFQVNKGTFAGNIQQTQGYDELVYICEDNSDIEHKEHTIPSEGFTVDYDNSGTNHIEFYETDTEKHYSLFIFPYDSFSLGLNPENNEISYIEINGRPACYHDTFNDIHAPRMLMWDDGCHICMLISAQENYDMMLWIAENLQ
ncbi:MAG: hypothetical protein K2J47_02005 [Ruminococcus sp.]|nr:hypothetical protein [Ruminococcus sp.]